MPADVTGLDLFALAWLLGLWTAFGAIQDHLLKGRTHINQHLKPLRRAWMERMLERDNRIMDAQLVGHTMNSCTFFASTTMLVLAGLVGSFGAIDAAHGILSDLSFVEHTSRQFLELKMLLLVAIFVYGFFKFTWALRQFNYVCALIGSAPMPPVPADDRRAMADNLAVAMTQGTTALNEGLRAYYFALAALGWMIGPWLLIAGSAAVVVILARRQGFSLTEKAIRDQADRVGG